MKFPCIACGVCCKKAGLVPQLARFATASGSCCYLDETTNRCQIYLNWPTVCNVQEMYKLYFQNQLTEKEYILQNLQVCYKLNKDEGQLDNALKIQKQIQNIK